MKLLKNKKIYIMVVVILFAIICALLFVLNNNKEEEKIVDKVGFTLKENGKLIVYVENSNNKKCSKCEEYKKYLDSKKINYSLFDVNNEGQEEYNKLLNKLNINKKIFNYPAIILVQDGIMFGNIININDTKTIDQFIEDYDLTNIK